MLGASDTAFSMALIRAEEAALPADEQIFSDPYAAIARLATAFT